MSRGILFLDEIHRLPKEGQEILFYLLDKGKFWRLGETEISRESKLMIIAATTESPENSLAGFLLSVYKRETLGSTYLKGGIAITIKAGAKFILSPVMLTKEIIDLCKQYSVISVIRGYESNRNL